MAIILLNTQFCPSPAKRLHRLHRNVDPPGLEPGTFGLQSRRSTTELQALREFGTPSIKGGDRAAGSPTATLLRLSPPCRTWIRSVQLEQTSSKHYSGGLTGGVCKEQGRIHRAMLARDY